MAQTATSMTYRVPETLPSDTEESVVGTEWHQEAIGALADMLRDVADRRDASWGLCEQIALVGLQYPDGRPYDPRPDVMVLARPLPGGHVSSIPLTEAGVPLFIAEVVSESTVGNDIGDKRHAYEAIGVSEYVLFDPVGNVLSVPLLAWRLEDGAYVSWRPDADGWWHSASLDVAFEATQPFLNIRDRDGVVIQPAREVRRHARRLEQQFDEVARERDEVARERDEVARERDALAQRQAADAQHIADLEAQLRRLQGERGQQPG